MMRDPRNSRGYRALGARIASTFPSLLYLPLPPHVAQVMSKPFIAKVSRTDEELNASAAAGAAAATNKQNKKKGAEVMRGGGGGVFSITFFSLQRNFYSKGGSR